MVTCCIEYTILQDNNYIKLNQQGHITMQIHSDNENNYINRQTSRHTHSIS